MESPTVSRQLVPTLAIYLPCMVVNLVAVHHWSIRTPMSFSATGYWLIVGDGPGVPAYVLYAILNFAYVWVSVRLLLRGVRVVGVGMLVLFVLSVAPFFLTERPAPVW